MVLLDVQDAAVFSLVTLSIAWTADPRCLRSNLGSRIEEATKLKSARVDRKALAVTTCSFAFISLTRT